MRELPKPVPVSEALQENGVDINVPEGQTLVAGPFERKHHEAFRLAEITSFKNLHLLGFIHPQITEERITEAIRHDDREYREVVRRQPAASHADCQCESSHARRDVPLSRRHFHHHLAELLQPLFRGRLAVDDPAVLHSYRHASLYLTAPARYIVGMFRLQDITIGDNATLVITPTVQALYANDVTIGNNGRLRFTSGGVHVRSKTLNGPNLLTSATSAVFSKYVQGLSREMRER